MLLRLLLLLAFLAPPGIAQERLEPDVLAAIARLGERRTLNLVSGWRDSIPVRTLVLSARGFSSADSGLVLAPLRAAFGANEPDSLPAHRFSVEIRLRSVSVDTVVIEWSEVVDSRCPKVGEWGTMLIETLPFTRAPDGKWSSSTSGEFGQTRWLASCPDRSPPG